MKGRRRSDDLLWNTRIWGGLFASYIMQADATRSTALYMSGDVESSTSVVLLSHLYPPLLSIKRIHTLPVHLLMNPPILSNP